jgi:hypothetical protein
VLVILVLLVCGGGGSVLIVVVPVVVVVVVVLVVVVVVDVVFSGPLTVLLFLFYVSPQVCLTPRLFPQVPSFTNLLCPLNNTKMSQLC